MNNFDLLERAEFLVIAKTPLELAKRVVELEEKLEGEAETSSPPRHRLEGGEVTTESEDS